MSIEQRIKYYKESLDFFEDRMEKYRFLLDQGKKAKPFPEEYRKETFIVSGCQANVWLVPEIKNNLLDFYFDSDAFISKGMITIICDIYGGNEPQKILATDFDLLNSLDLNLLLTPGRQNGVFAMLKKIKEHAKSQVEK